MRTLYCTAALALVAQLAVHAQAPIPAAQAPAEFTVFFRGVPIGTEEVRVVRSPEGLTVTGSSRLGPPVNVTLRRAEVRYGPDGGPAGCVVEGSAGDRLLAIVATVSGTTATASITQGTASSQKTHPIAADALILPNVFFGSYEALAARLVSMPPGAELHVYVPGQGQIPTRVTGTVEERIQTPAGTVQVRRFKLSLGDPAAAPTTAEVWADPTGRLVRFWTSQYLDVVRSDVASVAARREPISRQGDEQVRIPANGFSLAATLSKPTDAAGRAVRHPAVVLVGGVALTDRDEASSGIPIFGQVAGGLADAGFVVVRYDRRGVGQSGGRAESATLADYAEDVSAVVRFLRKRKDVDPDRVAVLGHGEGGMVALTAASRNKDIKALVLAGAPGTTGAELVLEQQRHALSRLNLPEAEKQARIALQQRIQQAVLTGRNWEGIPPEMRRQADTPWFQSLLAFDPATVVNRTRQPILVVHGALDKEIEPSNAERLAALARLRKRPAGEAVRLEVLPGLNHLLIPSATGEVDEYGTLTDKMVARPALDLIARWLEDALRKR